MKLTRKTKRILVVVATAILAILLLLLIANSIIAHYVKPRLISYLKETVHKRSNGLYTLDFDQIRLNLVRGSASISAIDLQADTLLYDSLRRHGGAPSMLVNLNSAQLDIRGVRLIKLLRNKQLDIDLIRIEKPEIVLMNYSAPKDTAAKQRQFDPYRMISPALVSLGVDHIRIEDGTMNYEKRSNETRRPLHLEGFFLETDGLYIDSLSSRDTSNAFYSEDLRLSLKGFRYTLSDSLYYLHFGPVGFSSKERQLTLDSLWLEPRYGEMEVHRITGKETDHLNLKTGRITASNFDIRRFLKNQELTAEEIHVEEARLVNFLYNFKQDDRPYQQVPHLAFKHFGLGIDLRRLTVENGSAVYRERTAGRSETGQIAFRDFNAVITNITNLPRRIAANPVIHAEVSTSFMDVGSLEVKFDFHMDRDDGYFTVDGSLGRMPIEAANPMLEAVAQMKIRRGTLQSLKFNFEADSTRSRGTMQFRYNNLNVELLGKQDSESNMKVASALANLLLLNSNNPPPEGPLNPGHIEFTRLKNKSIFNYMWKSLLTGFKSSVGISAERESQLRGMAESFKQRRIRRQQRHDQRKEERQERRAERRAEREAGN